MTSKNIMSRWAGTALGAVLALAAAPAFAQEAAPQEVPVTNAPAAATETPAVDPLAAETATPDPLAAKPANEPSTAASETVAETAPTVAKPGKTSPKTAQKATSTAPSKSTAQAVAVTDDVAAGTAPVAEAQVDPDALAPLPAAQPIDAPVAAVETPPAANVDDDALPFALGGGLGLLALGGAAFAARRRRRDGVADSDIVDEPTIARRPAMATRAATPSTDRSAFNWGPAPALGAAAAPAGRSWVDRAHRGPTPENPFLSLKKRLQRAAFYDQRERAVAAGKASPLSPMAGLPQRFANAVKSRSSAPSYGFTYAPA